MNKISLIILMLFTMNLKAQENLLINGDFEEYYSCPENETYPTEPPPLEIEQCIGWKAPTYGTSDYFNSCSSAAGASIPNNYLGYQKPFSGKGYLGALFYSNTGGTGLDGYNGTMWWEYVQGEFKDVLKEGNLYKIIFYISVANESDYAINEFGAYISNDRISTVNTASLSVKPQLIFFKEIFFKDTLNWVKMEGLFRANGGEKYITIGNFEDNIKTDTINILKFPDVQNYMSYFYIDGAATYNVSLEQPIANVFSPNNDELNDYWYLPNLPEYYVSIYNRWGSLIINSELISFKWDGTSQNGNPCTEGVYYYVIQPQSNSLNQIKGFIQLLK